MKRVVRKHWACLYNSRPPCCSLRQVPVCHLFGWKNGSPYLNRASTKFSGHMSSWLLGKWRSYHLTACSSNWRTTVLVPLEKDLHDKPALGFIWTWGKVTTSLWFLFESLLPGTMLQLLRLMSLVLGLFHISVCVCLSTCVAVSG